MELFESPDHYILKDGSHSLWCSRIDGTLIAQQDEVLPSQKQYTCLGKVHGLIGKFRIKPEDCWRLLLISRTVPVGVLPGDKQVLKITRVSVLSLVQSKSDIATAHEFSSSDLFDIEVCSKHASSGRGNNSDSASQKALQKTWNQLKQAAGNIKPKKLPFKIPPLGDIVGPMSAPQKEIDKDKEKLERRVLEEIVRMFNDSESFYFSPNADITNTVQREQAAAVNSSNNSNDFCADEIWRRCDDRFFWNKPMLQDLIDDVMCKRTAAGRWIVPVMMGYVQIEQCPIVFEDDYDTMQQGSSTPDIYRLDFKLCLVSRRSRHRADELFNTEGSNFVYLPQEFHRLNTPSIALWKGEFYHGVLGTRYKRRGVDCEGHTANYVETEQILEFSKHVVSFVQVRGSVPLYWSQTGIKYKPPPRIERSDVENHEAFCRHYDSELKQYSSVTSVSLVDRVGKEKIISDAFLRNILELNDPRVNYVAFDFHEYCRGMRFENVSLLTENIMDIIKAMKYCWVDQSGSICEQQGVFRVNCIDCLDRTNIVQSAIARIVLEIQCRKLGLLSPERQLASTCRQIYQQMWANNGDIISRQYAGTAALKGDYTRTGERRFAGLMKDGVNSANRYYINRVKDVYRQASIDLLLGNHGSVEVRRLLGEGGGEGGSDSGDEGDSVDDTESLVQKEENLKILIEECKKMLIHEDEECLGGWGLIDCEDLKEDPVTRDMDIILLLSQSMYYIARYDDETDQLTCYQEIPLHCLSHIEVGLLTVSSKIKPMCLRIYYKRPRDTDELSGADEYFHTFCTTNTRLFNNIVVVIRNTDEARESLRAIAESFLAAKKLQNVDLNVIEKKIDSKRSREHVGVIDIASQAQEQVESSVPHPSISRDSSSHSLRVLSPGQSSPSMHRKKPNNSIKTSANTTTSHNNNAQQTVTQAYTTSQDVNPASDRSMLSSGMVSHETGVLDKSRLDKGSESVGQSDKRITQEGRVVSEGRGYVVEGRGEGAGERGHVLLKSCGLVFSSSRQILTAVRHPDSGNHSDSCQPSGHHSESSQVDHSSGVEKSLSRELSKDEAAVRRRVEGGVVSRRRDELLQGQSRTRSLDIDLSHKMLKPHEQSEDLIDLGTDTVLTGKESNGEGWRPSEDQTSDNSDQSGYVVECEINPMYSSDVNQSDVVSSNGNKTAVSASEERRVDEVNDGSTGPERVQQNSVPSRRRPTIVLNDEETIEDSRNKKPVLERKISLLKMSHSEGALAGGALAGGLSSHVDTGVLELDDLDTDELEVGGSALAKFKVRMASLAIPTQQQQAAQQKQLQQSVKNNVLRSKLRFKECQTKVLIL